MSIKKPMNKIEKLINELCPDGVEFRELGEVGVLIGGSGLPKTDFTDSGIGCIHYGQIYTY
jgi:type I restriction enzyme S subunit